MGAAVNARAGRIAAVCALIVAFVGLTPGFGSAAGSTLVVDISNTDVDFVDPALAYYQPSWQLLYASCAMLVNYPDAAGADGARLTPELAAGLPTVSPDGTVYTFTMRGDYRFSSGAPVTPQAVKATIDRLANPAMNSPALPFIAGIVGVDAVQNGTATSVSGVSVDGDQLRITLTRPQPDFLARMAMPFLCVVPPGTPVTPEGVNSFASAGPYYVSSRTVGGDITLLRNPYYTGPRPSRFAEILYHVQVSPDESVRDIESGAVDYDPLVISAANEARIWSQYGPESGGAQQYFVHPTLAVRYLALNTSRPVFANAKRRQAVNFAIDRPGLIALRGGHAGTPTDQYLPPGMPGFRDESLYPVDGPDFARAQQLIDEVGAGSVVLYTTNSTIGMNTANLIKADLEKIGFTVTVAAFSTSTMYQKCGLRTEPVDICNVGWVADYADPFDFLFLFDGRTIRETGNSNLAYYDDASFDAKLDAAQALTGDDRYRAFGDLDIELARDAAPWVAWDNDNSRDFFSSRIGCQTYQPIYGMDLAALCLRQPVTSPPPPPSPVPPPPPKCVVPSVLGQTVAAARAALQSARCSLGAVALAFSKTIKKGRIISQIPRSGAELADGGAVRVIVSKGRAPIKHPARVVMCRHGKTIRVPKTQVKKQRKHGAKLGACRRTKRR